MDGNVLVRPQLTPEVAKPFRKVIHWKADDLPFIRNCLRNVAVYANFNSINSRPSAIADEPCGGVEPAIISSIHTILQEESREAS
jgi:hypothetical protein